MRKERIYERNGTWKKKYYEEEAHISSSLNREKMQI